MKKQVSLEPMPKETAGQTHALSNNVDGGLAGLRVPGGKPGPCSGQLEKAYPWLLGVSVALSVILCWMYVNKPVIVQDESSLASESSDAGSGLSSANAGAAAEAALIPSDSSLPGSNTSATLSPDTSSPALKADGEATLQKITPAMLAKSHAGVNKSQVLSGWESTNLKVQHILSADIGGQDLEKIVLNVPVLYQTRTMSWSVDDIGEARKVMQRLVVYERNLNTLRAEGQGILTQWNALLEKTTPTEALRADSPSLPYNHGQGSEPEVLSDTSTVIKVKP